MYSQRMLSAFYPVHTNEEGRHLVCSSVIQPRRAVTCPGLAPMRGPRSVPSDSFALHQSLWLNFRTSTAILQMKYPFTVPETCPCIIDWFGKVPSLLLHSVYCHHNNYGHTARGFEFVSTYPGMRLYFAGLIPPLLYAIW
jgi:hypothetical protein